MDIRYCPFCGRILIDEQCVGHINPRKHCSNCDRYFYYYEHKDSISVWKSLDDLNLDEVK